MQGTNYLLNDAAVSPAAWAGPTANTNTTSAVIDTGNIDGQFVAPCELLITSPAFTTTQLPDTTTATYSVETSTDSGFGAVTILADKVLVVTGASGAGALSATARFRIPTTCSRYVRGKVTTSSTVNASGVTSTIQLLF